MTTLNQEELRELLHSLGRRIASETNDFTAIRLGQIEYKLHELLTVKTCEGYEIEPVVSVDYGKDYTHRVIKIDGEYKVYCTRKDPSGTVDTIALSKVSAEWDDVCHICFEDEIG